MTVVLLQSGYRLSIFVANVSSTSAVPGCHAMDSERAAVERLALEAALDGRRGCPFARLLSRFGRDAQQDGSSAYWEQRAWEGLLKEIRDERFDARYLRDEDRIDEGEGFREPSTWPPEHGTKVDLDRIRTLEEAERHHNNFRQFYIVASKEARDAALGTFTEERAKLNAKQGRALEEIALAREEGISSTKLHARMNIKPKDFGYVADGLTTCGLVNRYRAFSKGSSTSHNNVYRISRYQRLPLQKGDANQNALAHSIVNFLANHENKCSREAEAKEALGIQGSKSGKAWIRARERLMRQGALEEVSVQGQKGPTGDDVFLKLVRDCREGSEQCKLAPYQAGPPAPSNMIKRPQVPLMERGYSILAAEGANGMKNPQFMEAVGFPNTKLARKMVDRFKAAGDIKVEKDSLGKNPVYLLKLKHGSQEQFEKFALLRFLPWPCDMRRGLTLEDFLPVFLFFFYAKFAGLRQKACGEGHLSRGWRNPQMASFHAHSQCG